MAETKVSHNQAFGKRQFRITVSECRGPDDGSADDRAASLSLLGRAVRAGVACIERELSGEFVAAPPGIDAGEVIIQVPLDIDASELAQRVAANIRRALHGCPPEL